MICLCVCVRAYDILWKNCDDISYKISSHILKVTNGWQNRPNRMTVFFVTNFMTNDHYWCWWINEENTHTHTYAIDTYIILSNRMGLNWSESNLYPSRLVTFLHSLDYWRIYNVCICISGIKEWKQRNLISLHHQFILCCRANTHEFLLYLFAFLLKLGLQHRKSQNVKNEERMNIWC